VCEKEIRLTDGTLTQWIFSSRYCSCKFPSPAVISAGRPDREEQQFKPIEETELELDNALFPIDRYKPLSELGKGASGKVYLCRDRLLGKKVAVKCLQLITPQQLVSFQMEARATSQLRHPGLVAIMDFGSTESGAPYMVKEYARGISLEQY